MHALPDNGKSFLVSGCLRLLLGVTSCLFGDMSCLFGVTSSLFGDTSSLFGDTSCLFGDTSRLCLLCPFPLRIDGVHDDGLPSLLLFGS